MSDFYDFLETNNISYERHDHPAVFTVEDVERLTPDLPGAKTKNLFLRDNKGKHYFLVVVGHAKRVNLKALGPVLGYTRLSFASPERLKERLGIEPGSVSLLAIINDSSKEVELIIDESLWEEDAFQFHPLVNTSTLTITREEILHFLESVGHNHRVLDVPGLD